MVAGQTEHHRLASNQQYRGYHQLHHDAYGQPLHCFDADMVTGHKIVVRTQPEGTKFVTLDGEEHTLESTT